MRSTVLFSFLVTAAIGYAQNCDSVNTVYDRTYQNQGVMFNVVAYDAVILDHLTANISWNTATFQLLYKIGGFQGYENTPGAWTSLGSMSVTSNNTQLTDTVPTVLPFNINLPMVAGDTIAFYLDAAPLSKIMLKATTIPWGTYAYTDASIGVSIARSMWQTFGVPFATPQIWNGSVAYCENTMTGITDSKGTDAISIVLAGNELRVVLPEDLLAAHGEMTLQVRDMTGRLLRSERITSARTHTTLAGMASGTYVVTVGGSAGLVHSGKVVLQ